MRKTESSRLFPVLPALLLVCGIAVWAPTTVAAQDRYRVVSTENLRLQPGPQETILARIQAGLIVPALDTRSGWIRIEVTGWIWARSVGRINSGDFSHRVTAQAGENLRDGPNGNIIGRFLYGALLNELGRRGNWVNVKRVAWMFGQSLARVSPLETVGSASAPTPENTRSGQPGASRAALHISRLGGSVMLYDEPDGTERAVTSTELPVTVIASSGEWVRIRMEGWVRESDVMPAGDAVLRGVSGAEVRSNPDIYAGKLVLWRLQYISLQVADELRRDLPPGQHYMLARGPMPEPGFVYALVSDTQVEELRSLAPLTELDVIGRVRRGRSQQLGNPIIEVVDIEVRPQQ